MMPNGVVFVAIEGSNANSGAIDAPFATIAHALSVIGAGDTIYLREGTYTTRVIINKSVVLRAYQGEAVTVQAAAGQGGSSSVFIQNAANVVIDSIVIDSVNYVKGVQISFSHDVTLQNLEIKNAYSSVSGVYAFGVVGADDGQCFNISVLNCHIHDIGGIPANRGFCHAVYISVPGSVVRGCYLHHCAGSGISWRGVTNGDLIADGNYIHDNSVGVGIYDSQALVTNNVLRDNHVQLITRYTAVSARFYHNTCIGGALAVDAKNFSNPAVTVDVANNVFDNIGTAVEVVSSVGTIRAHHNLYSRITNADTLNAPDVIVTSIVGDFAPIRDDGGANVKPLVGNPAIRAGVMLEDAAQDYGGRNRGEMPTLGAWELAAIRSRMVSFGGLLR